MSLTRSFENGEAQNETPSECDKMDISEVSDQVSPVSDQSQSDAVDNQRAVEGPMRLTPLDNASAIAAAPLLTTTTTTITGTTDPTGTTRGRLGSSFGLEGLDLELPSLDMYQEEYAEFPSSPKQLKERLEAHGLAMPLERDSGTTGGSEEEEEDTSIYQAVLSPDCQDVRLRKESFNEDTVLPPDEQVSRLIEESTGARVDSSSGDSKTVSRRVLTPNPEDAMLPQIAGVRENVSVGQDLSSEVTPMGALSDAWKGNTFPRLGKSNGRLISLGDRLKGRNLHNSLSNIPVGVSLEDEDDDGESSFVFERRDSKRLSRKDLGERIMEGLFVESRRKDPVGNVGLRKISAPKDLTSLDSPPTKHPSNAQNNEMEQNEAKHSDLKRLNVNGHSTSSRTENSFEMKNDLNHEDPMTNRNGHTETTNVPRARESGSSFQCSAVIETDRSSRKPVPAIRTRSILPSNPPCPKPRRKYRSGSESDVNSCSRDPLLLLDPSTLLSGMPRGIPKINPDGSVEVLQERPGTLVAPQRGGRRKIQVSEEILNGPAEEDNVSSGDSRLSDTDMMSPDDDPDLDVLLSPDLDTADELEDSIMERLGEPPPVLAPDPIPELSAAEERAEARSWRNCIVAGLERRIDMKVIEPYKRVLSHGGYLAAGSHNAIIVFSACFLPDRSRVDYDYVMDNLFLYVLTTLDQLITEDYVLIYLHGATQRSCMPTFSWLKRCYQMIDRRLRKNLKGLYLVHPTFWLKTIVLMTRPFVSSKFSRKLSFVETLADLANIVPLEQASIPDRVKQLEFDLQERSQKRRRFLQWWSVPREEANGTLPPDVIWSP